MDEHEHGHEACPDQRDHMLPAHRDFFDGIIESEAGFLRAGGCDDVARAGPDGTAEDDERATTTRTASESLYERFDKIVSTYQEQPQLLDPVLEGVVGRLASVLLEACKDGVEGVRDVRASTSLASHVSRFLWKVASVRGYKTVLRFMPCDVFSVEPVLRFLNRYAGGGGANDVSLSAASSSFSSPSSSLSASSLPICWECQYVLLMWSSQLVMVPFAFEVVCSTATKSTNQFESDDDNDDDDVIAGLLRTCKDLLRSASTSRDMAAGTFFGIGFWGRVSTSVSIVYICLYRQRYCPPHRLPSSTTYSHALAPPPTCLPTHHLAVCLGRLLTRPDMDRSLLSFASWAEGRLTASHEETAAFSRQFLLPGVALALATIFKFGKSQDETIRDMVTRFVPMAVDLYGSAECTRNPLVRKLSMKIVQRGATLLITADEVNLEEGSVEELLGAAVMSLLSGLSDRDTVVRWSAAKGVGRLAAKLDAEFADQLLDSILERNLSDVATGENAWHGGCLAVAELTRRELIASRRVDDLVHMVRGGLEYDVRRGYTSVGTNVRDAAAYVCWALARTQSRDDMAAALHTLAPVLMTTACYDREVNCRRAAAAAFQECVGRLGDFPHGIDILTVADFFTVSLRTAAYVDVAPLVAAFEGYHGVFAEHLVGSKLMHWDKAVRELAAEGLARLVSVDVPFHRAVTVRRLAETCVESTSLDRTHGATVAMACILIAVFESTGGGCEAAGENIEEVIEKTTGGPGPGQPRQRRRRQQRWLDEDVAHAVIAAVVRLAGTLGWSSAASSSSKSTPTSQSSSTLAGGENMRSALCRLIRSVSVCGVLDQAGQADQTGQAVQTFDAGLVLRCMYDICRENLRHPAEDVQSDASRALSALLDAHTDDQAFPVPLVEVVSSIAGEMHPDLHFGARRGAALAFGAFPQWAMGRGDLRSVIFDAVSSAVYPEEQVAVRDVETRVNAIRAIPHVVSGMDERGTEREREREIVMVRQAFDALLVALEDYSTDNRGDVGSWAREAAAVAGVELLFSIASNRPDLLAQIKTSSAPNFLAKVARLTVERIGRVREAAGRCLRRLFENSTTISALNPPLVLQTAVRTLTDDELLDGRAAARMLPCCRGYSGRSRRPTRSVRQGERPLGDVDADDALAREILLGAVYAVGGLDADLRNLTANHLVSAVSDTRIGDLFLSLWAEHSKSARLSAPFVHTADLLLSRTGLIEEADFVSAAVDATIDAIQGSTDVSKLCKAASILGIVAGEDVDYEPASAGGPTCPRRARPSTRARAAMGLVTLMGRKYPRVRTVAAEELYTAMLTWDDDELMDVDVDGDDDEEDRGLISILAKTPWGSSAPGLIREQRLRLKEKLDLILREGRER